MPLISVENTAAGTKVYTRSRSKELDWANIGKITYIPSSHGGSLTSSTGKRAFNSGVDTNFKRGDEEAGWYFLATGYTTWISASKLSLWGVIMKVKKNPKIDTQK